MNKSYHVLILISFTYLVLLTFAPLHNVTQGSELGGIFFVYFSFLAWIPGALLSVLTYLVIQRKMNLVQIGLIKVFCVAFAINLPGTFAIFIIEYVVDVLRLLDLAV